MNNKILITGSSGYVGYVLAKYFSENQTQVIGLDINPNPVWKGNNYYKFYKCDVRDKESLNKIFKDTQPTHVIHLAFLMDPLHDKEKNYEIDVIGSLNIFKIANTTDSIKQFIQFSSASTYGAWPNNKLWIKEDQELKPRDYRYGQHKKEIEEKFLKAKKREDMNLVILRMCTAIGPLYHKEGGVVSIMEKSPILTKINNRFCELQFLYEDDLYALIEKIVNDKDIKGIYNLAPDSFTTTKDLVPHKKFIYIPLFLMRGIVAVLWALKLVTMMPAAITLTTYGIIVDPLKLKKRYNYKFKYTTKEAYKKTVEERKKLGTL